MYNVGDYIIVRDLIGIVMNCAGNEVKLLCTDGQERVIRIDDPKASGLIASNHAVARLFYNKLIKWVQKT